MININDLKGHSAMQLLKTYSGINPYILSFKQTLEKKGKVLLTENQVSYIIDNYSREPQHINRVINITSYLGDALQEQNKLSFSPLKVLVEFILAETDKTFHVYGKLKQNQVKSEMYWLPKTQVVDDLYFEEIDIDVDFTKYNDILGKYGKQLYNHQEIGIKYLLTRNGCILSDDMGLGKTIQSIIASVESGAKKILIVCPSSTKINWEREINIFDKDTAVVDGKNWVESKYTIINFDILKNFHGVTKVKNKKTKEVELIANANLLDSNFDLVIIDEAHKLKNPKSIRSEIMVQLCESKSVKKVWLLSGTPVANRPMDFFNLLKLIKSPIAKNWKHYAVRYCDGKQFFRTLKNGTKKNIWLTDGASNLEELSNKCKNIILRRLKKDVLDMPDKIVTPVHHTLSDEGREMYNALWDEYIETRIEKANEIKDKRKRLRDFVKIEQLQQDLVELGMLRKFIAMEAIPHTIEYVENAIEIGRKVIIFTTYTEELEALSNYFGKISVKHNGNMTTKQKQRSVDSFQDNPNIKVFIGNIISAGVGITLTEATVVVFNSFDWVTGNNEQGEDRCYRIGQPNDVNVYYQLFDDTISTKMWEMLREKKENINIIIKDN